jgi:hypothetical protein
LTIRLNEAPETVFPLFTPEEEKKWAAGWDFEWVYPPDPDGDVEENFIFKTSAHDHHHGEAIWIIGHYDPDAYQIVYYRLEPGVKIGHIRIECQATEAGQTLATITYTYTGLSKAGHRFIEKFTAAHYQQFIESWERAINHFLETGEALPPGH